MIFKRRSKRPFLLVLRHLVYPPGGWLRAGAYVIYRLRRLPDKPHRIARGIAMGVFVSFTPFFGFHFVIAASLSWLFGGNIVAAILATFVGNPLTFPLIMTLAVELGSHMLGHAGGMPLHSIVGAFTRSSVELWNNLCAFFTGEPAHWTYLRHFFHNVFLPYLVGGLIPGVIAGAVAFYLSLPVIRAYQRRRSKRLKDRVEKLRAVRAAQAAGGTAPARKEKEKRR